MSEPLVIVWAVVVGECCEGYNVRARAIFSTKILAEGYVKRYLKEHGGFSRVDYIGIEDWAVDGALV
jgi:hypothetical protein